MFSNTSGNTNTATGSSALYSNTPGFGNTAHGDEGLYYNTTGDFNTASGLQALVWNTAGDNNTAIGFRAGTGSIQKEIGSNNTFVGYLAAQGPATPSDNATAVGANAVVSQSDSLVLGAPGVKAGINTSTPQSRLQAGEGTRTSYGDYVQLPLVKNTAKPPASDCNATNYVGRLILQWASATVIKLWACSTTGKWVRV